MKRTILIAILFLFALSTQAQLNDYEFYTKQERDSINKLKVGVDNKPTKYKPGFTYYNDCGNKITLIEYKKVATDFYGIDDYRWRALSEMVGTEIKYLIWTDDCWIDLYTDKAYYDRRNHKIVYYD